MANRKAGSTGDGNTADASRPAAVKKGAGGAAGGAGAQAGATGGRKRAAGARGPSATTRGDSTTTAEGGGAMAKSAARKSAGTAKKAAGPTKTTGAAKGAGTGAAKKTGARKNAGGGGKPDLRGDLRRFVDENPEGWGHDQWQGLLGHLGERGHDTSDPDRIGMELERERVSSRLEGVEGVNSRQAKTIADRFGTLHSLRGASADEIERLARVPRDLAEKIKNRLG